MLKTIEEEAKLHQEKLQSRLEDEEDISLKESSQDENSENIEENSENDEENSENDEENSENDEENIEKHSQAIKENSKSKKSQKASKTNKENFSELKSEDSQAEDFFDAEEMVRFADEGELEKSDPGFSASDSQEDSVSGSENENTKYSDFYKDPNHSSSEEEPEKLFSMVNESEMERLEQKLISEKP